MMTTLQARHVGTIITRWSFGMVLVSWRYLWQITPLHRSEHRGGRADDSPPTLPAAAIDDRVHLADEGVGPFYHRRFRVEIVESELTAPELMRRITVDFGRFVPSEVVTVLRSTGSGPLKVGDEFVIEMPGPWNGPVRVVSATETSLRLTTLRGHLEAGQVRFAVRADGALLTFEIQTWARSSAPLVWWLYCVLRLAKEIQLNMWVRFCEAVVADSGGRLRDGVWIQTREVPEQGRIQPVRS